MLAAVVLLLAGCGADGEADVPEAAGPDPEEPVAAATVLEVTVWPTGRGNGPEHVTTLECDPPGGTHPAPEESCAILDANPDLLEAVPEDVMCTQQYGGPEQARVRGTYRGSEVDLTYSRTNGCEISRWETAGPLFQVALS